MKWRIFPLRLPGCLCSWGTQLPWSSTWCEDASSFRCFSAWSPPAVVDILQPGTATWLLPDQWFHPLQSRLELSACWQTPLLPPQRAMLTAWWHVLWQFLPEGKPRALQYLKTDVCDPAITVVADTLFCLQRIFIFYLFPATDFFFFFSKKQIRSHFISKKISSNFILPECLVTSALLAPQLLSHSILG